MSDQPETVDLAFSDGALRRLTDEVASLRDDMNVLAAIVRRMDNGLGRMLDELRAMHAQQQRSADRLRRFEGVAP